VQAETQNDQQTREEQAVGRTNDRGTKASSAKRLALGGLVLLAFVLPTAPAVADGGNSIASAPIVTYGQPQLGNTATGQHLESSCFYEFEDGWRSYWKVNVLAGDELTIDWESVAEDTEIELEPVGTTDFTLFQTSDAADQDLASNGKAQLKYRAPVSGLMPLYFLNCGHSTSDAGPYSFTATAQHALLTALAPISNVYKNSTIAGSASLADGTPAPDGLIFHLVAKWHSGGDLLRVATSAATAGGGLVFQLALPGETVGKTVRLSVSRSEDPAYQPTRSTPVNVRVARSTPRPQGHRGKRKCRKGFKKRKVHGKWKCVRRDRAAHS
jgi:hypothetical protein